MWKLDVSQTYGTCYRDSFAFSIIFTVRTKNTDECTFLSEVLVVVVTKSSIF
jgi:hypothetical protein